MASTTSSTVARPYFIDQASATAPGALETAVADIQAKGKKKAEDTPAMNTPHLASILLKEAFSNLPDLYAIAAYDPLITFESFLPRAKAVVASWVGRVKSVLHSEGSRPAYLKELGAYNSFFALRCKAQRGYTSLLEGYGAQAGLAGEVKLKVPQTKALIDYLVRVDLQAVVAGIGYPLFTAGQDHEGRDLDNDQYALLLDTLLTASNLGGAKLAGTPAEVRFTFTGNATPAASVRQQVPSFLTFTPPPATKSGFGAREREIKVTSFGLKTYAQAVQGFPTSAEKGSVRKNKRGGAKRPSVPERPQSLGFPLKTPGESKPSKGGNPNEFKLVQSRRDKKLAKAKAESAKLSKNQRSATFASPSLTNPQQGAATQGGFKRATEEKESKEQPSKKAKPQQARSQPEPRQAETATEPRSTFKKGWDLVRQCYSSPCRHCGDKEPKHKSSECTKRGTDQDLAKKA